MGTDAPTLEDIVVTLPTVAVNGSTTIAPCPPAAATLPTNYFTSVPTPHALTGITATAITGIVPASDSNVAFVTYTGTSGLLPLYAPATGQVAPVTLSGSAAAPVAGVFSTDNSTFYAGTSGDDQVHVISVTGTTGTDTGVITPQLTDPSGNPATPNLIVQRARRSTS